MRFTKKLGRHTFTFCIETNNPLLPQNQSNQVFHTDFNIYKGGRK